MFSFETLSLAAQGASAALTKDERYMEEDVACVFIGNRAGGYGGAVMLEPVDVTGVDGDAAGASVDVTGCGFKANTGLGRQPVRDPLGATSSEYSQNIPEYSATRPTRASRTRIYRRVVHPSRRPERERASIAPRPATGI
eukprot:1181763-Prorocentrum_minimum.AAC.1